MKKILPILLCIILLAACGKNVSTGGNGTGKETIKVYAAPSDEMVVAIDDLSLGIFWGESSFARCAFPENWSDATPIKLFCEKETIEIRPIKGEYTGEKIKHTNAYKQSRDAVKYGEWIFSPTMLGVNTETVGTAQLEIKFNDLKYSRNSEDYMLFSREDDVKAMVYASLDGKAEVASKSDSEYLVKFSGEGTLNQSINFYIPKQPDTCVYERISEDSRYYLSPYSYFGDEKRGNANAFVRFESLDWLDASADEIVSAKYVVQNLTTLKSSVKLSAYGVKSDWCSINTTWPTRPILDDKAFDTVSIKSAGEYKFDVTDLLKEMLQNRGEARKGVVPEPGLQGVTENSPQVHSIRHGFALKVDGEIKERMAIASGDNGLFSLYLEIVVKR